MLYFFIGLFILIIIGAITSANSKTKKLKENGFEMKNFKRSGKLLNAVPITDKIYEDTSVYFKEDKLIIFNSKNALYDIIGEIDFKNIINYSIEDKSTIQSRVGLKRLMVAGIFAFAMKKNTKIELSYIVIEWVADGFNNETVFEFQGNEVKLINYFTNELQNKLILYRKNK